MREEFKNVYKVLPKDELFEKILDRFLALAVPMIGKSHLDDSVVRALSDAAKQANENESAKGSSSIENEMNPILPMLYVSEKPSMEGLILKNPLVFATANNKTITRIMEGQLHRIMEFFSGILTKDITLAQSVREILENSSNFGLLSQPSFLLRRSKELPSLPKVIFITTTFFEVLT